MKARERRVYRDFSIDAEIDVRGKLVILEGKDAVENALRQWLVSFRGEQIRRPNKGGYVTQWLLKPVNERTRVAIERAIRDGLYEDFTPEIVVDVLEVTPNYEHQFWEIHLEGYSPEARVPINLHEQIRIIT